MSKLDCLVLGWALGVTTCVLVVWAYLVTTRKANR